MANTPTTPGAAGPWPMNCRAARCAIDLASGVSRSKTIATTPASPVVASARIACAGCAGSSISPAATTRTACVCFAVNDVIACNAPSSRSSKSATVSPATGRRSSPRTTTSTTTASVRSRNVGTGSGAGTGCCARETMARADHSRTTATSNGRGATWHLRALRQATRDNEEVIRAIKGRGRRTCPLSLALYGAIVTRVLRATATAPLWTATRIS